MADAKEVALVRLKAGGRVYEVGEAVPKQDDMDLLRERGLVGSPSDLKRLEKDKKAAEDKVSELEAQVAELEAALGQAQLAQVNATADTQESVTDAEAKQIGT